MRLSDVGVWRQVWLSFFPHDSVMLLAGLPAPRPVRNHELGTPTWPANLRTTGLDWRDVT